MRMVYMWCALVSDINLTDHTGSKPQARFGSWLQPWRPLCSSHIIMFPVLTPGALFRLPSSLLHISGLSLLLLSWRSLGTTWMQPVCVVPPRGSPFVHVFTLFPHCPPPLLVLIILFLERIWHPVEILKTHKNLRTSKLWCNSNFISWALPSLVLFYKLDMYSEPCWECMGGPGGKAVRSLEACQTTGIRYLLPFYKSPAVPTFCPWVLLTSLG